MSKIQTVRGPIIPGELGVTYSHDHLYFRPPSPHDLEDTDLCLDSIDAAIKELKYYRAAGGQALVEMTTSEMGRNPVVLNDISKTTGIHIIAASGYHKDKFSRELVSTKSVDEIARMMVKDLTEGMDGTSIRAGVIKASTSQDQMTKGEKKVLQAAALAHRETGAPVSTHTEAGTLALEQIDILLSGGVAPEHIVIGHLDLKLDWDYLKAVAECGVFIGFDQISKEKYAPDFHRIEFIKRLATAGYARQILLSGDLARKSNWPSYGFGNGPGLTYILWRFVPWMLAEGVKRGIVDDLLINNPANAFVWAD